MANDPLFDSAARERVFRETMERYQRANPFHEPVPGPRGRTVLALYAAVLVTLVALWASGALIPLLVLVAALSGLATVVVVIVGTYSGDTAPPRPLYPSDRVAAYDAELATRKRTWRTRWKG